MILYQPPAQHPRTPVKVVLLSGLSDPATCALTRPQRDFLAALSVPEEWKLYWNFPYLPSPEWRGVPLWLASLRNARLFLTLSRRPCRAAVRRHWLALVESTERLVVVTLSCGLEIVRQCLGPTPAPRPLDVVALGPVAWTTPPVSCTLIQGTRDYLSKLFFRKATIVVPAVGHMDYLHSPQVLQEVNEALWISTSRWSAPACTCRDDN